MIFTHSGPNILFVLALPQCTGSSFVMFRLRPVLFRGLFFFFCGVRDSNLRLCIYYALFLRTELSSRGPF